MFLIFNKEKINSYLISVGTVVFLLVIGLFLGSNKTVETSTNQIYLNDNNVILERNIKNNI